MTAVGKVGTAFYPVMVTIRAGARLPSSSIDAAAINATTPANKKGGQVGIQSIALREAARRMTQHYDTALAPSGLRTTQFLVLTIPRRLQPISLGALAGYLVMDRAALGHNERP